MRRAYIILLCVLLSACGVTREHLQARREAPVPNSPPEPAYVIGPGDQLQIGVYGQPELSREYTVTAEGHLSMPLAGQLPAAGLSVVQLEDELRRRLAEYLVNPQVTVAVRQSRQRFTVMGEVQKPGSYPLEKRTTVLEAISMAGGFTSKAAPNRTRVIRNRNGREVAIDVAVGAIMEGDSEHHDIPLQPDDKIVVPESFF